MNHTVKWALIGVHKGMMKVQVVNFTPILQHDFLGYHRDNAPKKLMTLTFSVD